MAAPPFQRAASTPEPHDSLETVTITIPSGKQYLVHARTLTHLSDYFHTALKSNFIEGKLREFHLTEHCDDQVMGIFTSWLYFRCTAREYKPHNMSFMNGVTLMTAVKAWLLGDYLLAPKFQNDMMRCIINGDTVTCGPKIIREFGDQVPEDSALETFFIYLFCHLLIIEKVEDQKVMFGWLTPRLHEQVLKELVEALRECDPFTSGWLIDILDPYYVEEGRDARE